ncbi:hypothetical protein [Novosphingobium resinovorum]|uniref:hypothetical protein n=1 Tax=Novosphingobium resinovorum TaxID=158500 RepID=UPI002ED03EB7|nr:hypothetical protein [Novosphingobium resinovorum]
MHFIRQTFGNGVKGDAVKAQQLIDMRDVFLIARYAIEVLHTGCRTALPWRQPEPAAGLFAPACSHRDTASS